MRITERKLRRLIRESMILEEGWLDDLNAAILKDPDVGKEFNKILSKAKSGKLSAIDLARAGLEGGRKKAKKTLGFDDVDLFKFLPNVIFGPGHSMQKDAIKGWKNAVKALPAALEKSEKNPTSIMAHGYVLLLLMQIVPVIPVGAATRIQAPVLKAIAPLTKRISTVLSKSKSVFKKYPKVTKQINHAEKAIKKIEFIVKRDRGAGIKKGEIGRTATGWRGEKFVQGATKYTTTHDEARYIIRSRNALKKAGLEDHYVKVKAMGKSNVDGAQAYIMEKVPGIGFDDIMKKGVDALTGQERKTLAKQLDNIIKILHKNKLPHGDLHARNIMITGKGKTIKAVLIDPAPSRAATSATKKVASSEPYRMDKLYLARRKAELLYPAIHEWRGAGVPVANMVKWLSKKAKDSFPNKSPKEYIEIANKQLAQYDQLMGF